MLPDKSSVFKGEAATVICGLAGGFFFVAALIAMQNSIRVNGAILTTAFSRLGLLVPLAVSFFLFGDRPGLRRIIGICLAMIIFFLQIPLPEVVTAPISFVGSITSPLSMIIIGSSAAAYPLKLVFSQKKVYLLSALRLLVYPILAYFILKLTLGDNLLTRIICIYIGMPTASVVGMTIGEATIAGVVSRGMCCSAAELGIADSSVHPDFFTVFFKLNHVHCQEVSCTSDSCFYATAMV